MDYITVKQAAAKWGISERRVHKLCQDNRIEGQKNFSNVWMIPSGAEKPADQRIKSGKYRKDPSEWKRNKKNKTNGGDEIVK